ncbi:hypothetical protein BC360_03685 [Ensifer sp. LC163]|nr:hypothetical protein BC360_03685 [Ensifer sp. LC163]
MNFENVRGSITKRKSTKAFSARRLHPADIGSADDRPFPGAKTYAGKHTHLIQTSMTDQRQRTALVSASLQRRASCVTLGAVTLQGGVARV